MERMINTRGDELFHANCPAEDYPSSLTLGSANLYRSIQPHTSTSILSLYLYADIHRHVDRPTVGVAPVSHIVCALLCELNLLLSSRASLHAGVCKEDRWTRAHRRRERQTEHHLCVCVSSSLDWIVGTHMDIGTHHLYRPMYTCIWVDAVPVSLSLSPVLCVSDVYLVDGGWRPWECGDGESRRLL